MSTGTNYAKYKALAEKYLMASVIELMKDRSNLYYGYFLAEMKKLQNYRVQSFKTTITIQGIQLEYNPVFVTRTYSIAGHTGLLQRLVVELNHLTLLHPEAGPIIKTFVEGMANPEILAAAAMDVAANYYTLKGEAVPCPLCNPHQWDIDNEHVYRNVVLETFGNDSLVNLTNLSEGVPTDSCSLCNGSKHMFNMEAWAGGCATEVAKQVCAVASYNSGIEAIKHIATLEAPARNALCAYMARYQLGIPEVDDSVSPAVANSIIKSTVHHIMAAKGVTKKGQGVLAQFLEKIKPVSVSYILTLKGMLSASMGTNKVSTRYRPNRRFGYQYPGRRSYPKMKYIVAIDTSGSVSSKEVAAVMGELMALKRHSTEVECRVLLFHHQVWADMDLDNFNIEEFNTKFQSGGTNFDNVLKRVFEGNFQDEDALQASLEDDLVFTGHRDKVVAEHQAMLVMMTDGYCGIGYDRAKVNGRIVWLITDGGSKVDVLRWDPNAEVLEIN